MPLSTATAAGLIAGGGAATSAEGPPMRVVLTRDTFVAGQHLAPGPHELPEVVARALIASRKAVVAPPDAAPDAPAPAGLPPLATADAPAPATPEGPRPTSPTPRRPRAGAES